MSAAHLDQLPRAAREVVELYRDRADDLCFPNVDASILEKLQAEVLAASANVEAAQTALNAARAAQREQEEALMALAKKAYAYATIFAETDPELAETLESFELAQPSARDKPAKKKPVTRKRKSDKTSKTPSGNDDSPEELPFEREQRIALA